jgi:hypothetical protein
MRNSYTQCFRALDQRKTDISAFTDLLEPEDAHAMI